MSVKLILLIRRMQPYWYGDTISLDHIVGDKDKVRNHIATWPFSYSYMETRKRLREIAQLSWRENRFDAIINWSDRNLVDALAKQSEPTWIIPMDEDDWLAPDAEKIIRSCILDSTIRIITWRTVRRQADGSLRVNHFQESCGYAIKLPCDWQEVCNHMKIPRGQVHIGKELAFRNETVASLGHLLHTSEPLKLTLHNAIKADCGTIPKDFQEQYFQYRTLLSNMSGIGFY